MACRKASARGGVLERAIKKVESTKWSTSIPCQRLQGLPQVLIANAVAGISLPDGNQLKEDLPKPKLIGLMNCDEEHLVVGQAPCYKSMAPKVSVWPSTDKAWPEIMAPRGLQIKATISAMSWASTKDLMDTCFT